MRIRNWERTENLYPVNGLLLSDQQGLADKDAGCQQRPASQGAKGEARQAACRGFRCGAEKSAELGGTDAESKLVRQDVRACEETSLNNTAPRIKFCFSCGISVSKAAPLLLTRCTANAVSQFSPIFNELLLHETSSGLYPFLYLWHQVEMR
eukprot:681849-Hanusia_phi.AAC.2